MNIDVKYTNVEHDPIFHRYLEKKIGGLERLIRKLDGGVTEARIELARTTRHHRKGTVYRAETNLCLPRRLLRAEAENGDMRAAVDAMYDRLEQEIIKYKEMAKSRFRKSPL